MTSVSPTRGIRGMCAEMQSLRMLFAEELHVAPWQRNYSWEVDVAQQFFTSLWHAFESLSATATSSTAATNQQQSNDYYIGTIFTSAPPSGGGQYLHDGQQRLTTCVLLMAACLQPLKPPFFQSGKEVVTKLLGYNGRESRLRLGKDDDEEMHAILDRVLREYRIEERQGVRMNRVVLSLLRHVEEKAKTAGQDVVRFLEWIGDHVVVQHTKIFDESTALAVFKSINRPATPLNDGDLFLAEVMRCAQQWRVKTNFGEWKKEFDALRDKLSGDAIAAVAIVTRTLLIQCEKAKHGETYHLRNVRAEKFSGVGPYDFFRAWLQEKGGDSTSACDDLFQLFMALGCGLHSLIEQPMPKTTISILRVLSLDVRAAIEGVSPWLASLQAHDVGGRESDDSVPTPALRVDDTGRPWLENTLWLSSLVLLATIENSKLRRKCTLLGDFVVRDGDAVALSRLLEHYLLDGSLVLMCQADLIPHAERQSRTFLQSVFSGKERRSRPRAVTYEQLRDFELKPSGLRWLCRYLLQRYGDLEASSMSRHQVESFGTVREYQIEHIAPRGSTPHSDWIAQGWRDSSSALTASGAGELHKLGNLTLLSKTDNSRAAQHSFSVKCGIYVHATRTSLNPRTFLDIKKVSTLQWTPYLARLRRMHIAQVLFNDIVRAESVTTATTTNITSVRSTVNRGDDDDDDDKVAPLPLTRAAVLESTTSTVVSNTFVEPENPTAVLPVVASTAVVVAEQQMLAVAAAVAAVAADVAPHSDIVDDVRLSADTRTASKRRAAARERRNLASNLDGHWNDPAEDERPAKRRALDGVREATKATIAIPRTLFDNKN